MTTMSGDGPDGPRPGRATLRDVAALAGVSLKTVSRVLNLESAVSDQARTRVAEAVAALSYRRNGAARSLRSGRGGSSSGRGIADLANPSYGISAKGGGGPHEGAARHENDVDHGCHCRLCFHSHAAA